MKIFFVIILLLVIIILSVLTLQVKETFIEVSSNDDTCYGWINNNNNTLKQYVTNLDSSNLENENLIYLLQSMKAKNNVMLTENGNLSVLTSPCILTTAAKQFNKIDNVSCANLGFAEQNDNGDCIHHIENTNDIESLKIAASNLYNIKHKEELEKKKALEADIEIANTQLTAATEDNIIKTQEYVTAYQNYLLENNNTIELNRQRAQLSETLNTVSDTSLIQNKIQRSENQIQNMSTIADLLNTNVIFYADTSYRGNRVSNGVGRYATNTANVKSIRIPAGLKVTLYEYSNFTGMSETFQSSIGQFGANSYTGTIYSNQNWNNRIGSFVIQPISSS